MIIQQVKMLLAVKADLEEDQIQLCTTHCLVVLFQICLKFVRQLLKAVDGFVDLWHIKISIFSFITYRSKAQQLSAMLKIWTT
jgi:hypothetical protein